MEIVKTTSASSTDMSDMRQVLEDAQSQLGLATSPRITEVLLAYLRMLERWNQTYNLTSVRDPRQMLTHHLADCLAVVGPLHRELAHRQSPKLVDVGSGGGLPGVVIAATSGHIHVACVDSVGKKAAFIRQVAAELGLTNLHADHARIETLPPAQADVITSRAFATLNDFASVTERHLAPNGVWMAMKGKAPDAEIAAIRNALDVFHVEPLTVPGLAADRCIVWMRPVRPTG